MTGAEPKVFLPIIEIAKGLLTLGKMCLRRRAHVHIHMLSTYSSTKVLSIGDLSLYYQIGLYIFVVSLGAVRPRIRPRVLCR